MKFPTLVRFILLGASVTLSPSSSHALNVPVAQDSTNAFLTGKLTAVAGRAPLLSINYKQTTLLRFDLNDPVVVPPVVQPLGIKSATLRLYVVRTKLAANVTVHRITSDWKETIVGLPVTPPDIDPTPLATIAPAEFANRTYVNVDLTQAIKDALISGNVFGFALKTTDPLARIMISSKEGPGTGAPPSLEIEANTALDGNGDITSNLTGNVTGNLKGNVTGILTGSVVGTTGSFNSLLVSSTFSVPNNPFNIGLFNNFLGSGAGANNTSGACNTFLGQAAGTTNTTDSFNTFIGSSAGGASTGSSNIFIGSNAGFSNSASQNVFLGVNAGIFNTTGTSNVFVGFSAGADNTTGNQNSFFGINAGLQTTNSFNSFFGAGAGQSNQSGLGNSAIGNVAGFANTSGSNNTFLGGNSGNSNTTESKNTFVGDSANGVAGITNSTAVGQGASVTASNAVVLGNGCSVGIRTSAPNSTLQVSGSLSLPVRSINNNLLVSLTDTDYVLINTGTLGTSIVLPQPAGLSGRVYVVKNRSTASATLTFATPGPLIEGAASLSLATNTVTHVICDGTNWYKIN